MFSHGVLLWHVMRRGPSQTLNVECCQSARQETTCNTEAVHALLYELRTCGCADLRDEGKAIYLCLDLISSLAGAVVICLPTACVIEGMVLLELITRKKIGEDGFARRTPAKLFALEAEEVRQESPPDAPDSLLNLAAM